MVMKPDNEGRLPEMDEVWITPAFAAKAIPAILRLKGEMSLRMLTHWVKVTIGEPTIPSEGRGSTRGFSLMDICLMIIGMRLAKQIGFDHQQTRTCVLGVRDAWKTLLPGPYESVLRPDGSFFPCERSQCKFLVAEERAPHYFEASIVPHHELDFYVIGAAENPVVVLNVTSAAVKAMAYLIRWFNAPPQHKKAVGLD
jgi:hypothetical protein